MLEKKNYDDQAEKTGTKKNKIDKAVLFHLGNEIPEETEPDEEKITDRFVICQITDLEDNSTEEQDKNGGKEPSIIVEDGGIKADTDYTTKKSERGEFFRVLNNVARSQFKTNPTEWADAVMYKLSLIGIITNTLLFVSLPHLNTNLSRKNQSTFHNTTLAGLSAEVRRALTGDQTIIPDFCPGHA